MTVSLVTGGSGYFGSLLVRRLLEAGHEVRVLDLVDAPDRPPVVAFVGGDVCDPAVVRAAVDGVDVVFHNIAQVPVARDAKLFRRVNVDGTVTLLDACRERRVHKVVHTSSSAVFGVPAHNPVLPSTVPSPAEPYGQAKLAAEWACLAAVAAGLDVSIVRPRTILGHGRLGIFGILFEWIADGADVFVMGSGGNRYQFVHADDLAELCILAGAADGPMVLNGGTDRFGTMRESLESLCAHAATGSHVRRVPMGPASLAMRTAAAVRLAPFAPYHWLMYGRSMWFDIEHAQRLLGWQPRWSNAEMLADSYDWFVAHRAEATAGSSPHRRASHQGALRLLKHATRLLPR